MLWYIVGWSTKYVNLDIPRIDNGLFQMQSWTSLILKKNHCKIEFAECTFCDLIQDSFEQFQFIRKDGRSFVPFDFR